MELDLDALQQLPLEEAQAEICRTTCRTTCPYTDGQTGCGQTV